MPPKRTAAVSKKADPNSKKPKTNEKQKSKELHQAVKDDDVPTLKKLLDEGTFVDIRDEKGETPLYYAVSNRQSVDLVKELLKYGANPMAEIRWVDMTILHIAAGKLFVNEKRFPCAEVVEELLKHGADVNATTYHGSTPLSTACGVRIYDDVSEENVAEMREIVKILIKNGATVSTRELFSAVQFGNHLVVQELLKNGAKPNLTDENDYTPLHRVARKLDVAFPKIKDGPNNSNIPEMITALIEHGADVNAQDCNGKTPMHHFVSDEKLLSKYIEKGGDKINYNIKDNIGLTALDSTMEKGKIMFPEAAKMIAKNMSKGALKRAQTKSKTRREDLQHEPLDPLDRLKKLFNL